MKWYSGENLPATHARPTFSEAWLHERYGFEFGEKYFRDPIFRTEQDQETLRVICERFPDLGIGQDDPKPRPHVEICGHRFLPALLGSEVVYQVDQPPAVRHRAVSCAQDISTIAKPNLKEHPLASEFRRQARMLRSRYGQVDATINHGGPLNVAGNVLGTEAFLYLADSSEALRDFLRRIAELCLETYDELTLEFTSNLSLEAARELFLGNCPVMMLDPATYRQEVFPADQFLRRNVKKFGLHHCGPMDRYLESYRHLGPFEYIEVGWGSTISKVRETFPDTILDLMINIPAVQAMSPDTLAASLREMVAQAAPRDRIRDVYLADIGPNVPDATVENFVNAVNGAFSSR